MIGAIGGFDSYGGLLGSYKMQNIPKVDEATVRAQDEARLSNASSNASLEAPGSVEASSKDGVSSSVSKVANLQDISLTFNKENDFGYIGSDSDLGKLDMDKAISDMKKDSVLEQYQYFVGNQGMNILSSMDGSVVMK